MYDADLFQKKMHNKMYCIWLVPMIILLLVLQWMMMGEKEEEAMPCVDALGLDWLVVKFPELQCVGGCHLGPALQVGLADIPKIA